MKMKQIQDQIDDTEMNCIILVQLSGYNIDETMITMYDSYTTIQYFDFQAQSQYLLVLLLDSQLHLSVHSLLLPDLQLFHEILMTSVDDFGVIFKGDDLGLVSGDMDLSGISEPINCLVVGERFTSVQCLHDILIEYFSII